MNKSTPKWHTELEMFSNNISSLIIVDGNIHDIYRYPGDDIIPKGAILGNLAEYLFYFYKNSGYENIVFYDNIKGFYNNFDHTHLDKFAETHQCHVNDGYIRVKLICEDSFHHLNIVRHALQQSSVSTVIIMESVSSYITSAENMAQYQIDCFRELLESTRNASEIKGNNLRPLKNLLVMTADNQSCVPSLITSAPITKTVNIPTPTSEEITEILQDKACFQSFFSQEAYNNDIEYYNEHPKELTKLQDKFAALSSGYSLSQINDIRKICVKNNISIRDLCSGIDLYKYGVKETPWQKIDKDTLKDANDFFEKRVKGQRPAVEITINTLKRAVMGMASGSNRPKGVLFFAGPTGTGKTETAKTLAEFLFKDENAMLRFDMSEYGQEHSDQKLFGAPPGYVGHEAGGKLTNEVMRKPFSVILFDEIEKAHPKILDKFLQILDDGRMTDGQGNTAYFSESIIVFTSNLGIYKEEHKTNKKTQNVDISMPYEDVSSRVIDEIKNYFTSDLGRPEILNRIGEHNIIVFDFIRENIANEILDYQIEKVVSETLAEHKVKITFSDKAKETITTQAFNNLENGGRGIRNVVEKLLSTPLPTYLFDNDITTGDEILINDIDVTIQPPKLICEKNS